MAAPTQRTRGSRHRIAVPAVLAGGVLAGCGGTPASVGVNRLTSDIIFGVPTPHAASHSAAQQALASADNVSTTVIDVIQPINNSGFQIQGYAPGDYPVYTPPQPQQFLTFPDSLSGLGLCPAAPAGANPKEAASADVDGPPKAVTYKYESLRVHYDATGAKKSSVLAFEQHTIQNVVDLPDQPSAAQPGTTIHRFTYDLVQPDPDLDHVMDTITFSVNSFSDSDWQAGTTSVAANQQSPGLFGVPPQTVPNPQIGPSGSVDPSDGIAIVKETRVDTTTNATVDQFIPTTPLKIFTLPVGLAGYEFNFTSTDAADQTVMQITAYSGSARRDVDACGQLVDGWPTLANVAITKPDATTHVPTTLNQNWSYVVSPQYGGLIIDFNIDGQVPTGKLHTIDNVAVVPMHNDAPTSGSPVP